MDKPGEHALDSTQAPSEWQSIAAQGYAVAAAIDGGGAEVGPYKLPPLATVAADGQPEPAAKAAVTRAP